MKLLPRELDKLTLHNVGYIAQKRLARGLKLNHTEATALIASVIVELIRDGEHSVAQLMQVGREILGTRHVLSEVISTLDYVQVEAAFKDGTKLVTVHDPISSQDGDLSLALHGSFLPIPSQGLFPLHQTVTVAPGALSIKSGKIKLNPTRAHITIPVTNEGDRPIQVGSHFHFIETNKLLAFDRYKAHGKRLAIPAGTSVRFEPGDSKLVTLVEIGGAQIISGGNALSTSNIDDTLDNLISLGFRHVPYTTISYIPKPYEMDRQHYADAYGPTTGDKLRLADSDLWIEIMHDATSYGDECVFGGGKVLREGMGQANGIKEEDALDLVITNAVILDHSGVFKADIGIKSNHIVGIGKAGNPQIMDITPGMIVGVSTEVLSAEGNIITAGAIDTHIHFICPQIADEALSSGITTLIGGGTGPNTGSNATTCTPGKIHIEMMLQATDSIPMNFGFTGKGNSSSIDGVQEMVLAGCVGLKLHEDWGTSPSAINTCLSVCDDFDIQTTIHTDTLNETGFVESTLGALKGRTIHMYHIEGAGGGHAPDIITACSLPNVIPSSTNPTRPYTINTIDEHLDMLMVCHHLSKDVPEDVAFAESRIRGETIGAEDWLHDIGGISIISSDSQAMGRVGEVITRTWQTANKMKGIRREERDVGNDNFRVMRYISKYTINPAIAHGISHLVGSVEVGKLADLVMWKPCLFGTKPEIVIKGGFVAKAMMGDANASIPTPQPVISRPMFGSFPSALSKSCIAFVSQASITNKVVDEYKLNKRVEAVKNCRGIGKKDMVLNDLLPDISVDPETYQVQVDGKLISVGPAERVCMSQNSFLF